MWELTIKQWYGTTHNMKCKFDDLEEAAEFIETVQRVTEDEFEFVLVKRKVEKA